MQSLILAGGKGTRLRPLTIHTPKPVVPIVNRPFLLYQIDLLKRAGIKDVILSLSYQPGKIEEILADGQDYGVRIRYAVEASPLGTAGAYKNAQEHLDQPTVVFNGDIFTDLDLAAGEPFYAYTWSGYWLDIGAPARYLQAHDDLLGGRVKSYRLERPPISAINGDGEPPRVDALSVVDPSCTLKPGVEIVNSVLG